MKQPFIILTLLLTTLAAFSQTTPPLHLDFEPPDAFMSSTTYNEDGRTFTQVSTSNTGSSTYGPTADLAYTGTQSFFITVPANPSSTVDPTIFSRREWRLGVIENNQTYWVSFRIYFRAGHENPMDFGRILSQVKLAPGYGFQFGFYNMVGAAGADIPIGLRYFERTGPNEGDIILDSGEISSGVTLARGAWHVIKYQFRNSSTAGDAFVRLWVNGALALERTNLTVVAYSASQRHVRGIGNYSRYEPRRVEINYDDFKFGLNESDVDGTTAPPDPEDPPVDDGEFDSVAIASNMKRYFHVQAEAVVNATNINGLAMVSKGDPAPLAAADITGPAVAFMTNGLVYARDYGLNRARQTVNYTAGTTNILDFYITTETQRYDVWITLPGGSPLLLGRNYGFTNLFDEYSHVGWTTNLTVDLTSHTNIIRSATINSVVIQ